MRLSLWAAVILTASGLYQAGVTFLEFATGTLYQSIFYFWIVLLHIALGFLVILPLAGFVTLHVRSARGHSNRRARRAGIALAAGAGGVVVAGLLLVLHDLPAPWISIAYWLHILTPLLVVALYVRHRRAGPHLAWRRGVPGGVAILLLVAAFTLLHGLDPRGGARSAGGVGADLYAPSLARTASGGTIDARVLSNDEYCEECHADIHAGWLHSAHHFSSFNNPAYRFSVLETRQVLRERDGDAKASRWCAGCHDPVPLFAGRFDDRAVDQGREPTAEAGITCTVCHSITGISSTRGNGDYVIEEPLHYPFAFSRNPLLRWINRHLVRAKPLYHKRTFLKPLHRTAEFCSVCHKVHIPREVNHYKDFLRGQNHYDSWLLSGVSGHGARSFYYPAKASPDCSSGCHMPWIESADDGNRDGRVHDHLFPGANTALPALRGEADIVERQSRFLRDGVMRIDLFGLRRGGTIRGELLAPLGPRRPVLEPGKTYLLEVVLRTAKMGHHFTQGTADSNQVWVEIVARDGERTLGRSGEIDSRGFVDPEAHFVNALVLDRRGNRIDRRNAQDIFVPLYDHQMPPGTGQVVHYRLEIPSDASGAIEISARLRYRKFDRTYMEYVFGSESTPALPAVVLAEDRIRLPTRAGSPPASAPPAPRQTVGPLWQRWNDYGIGLLLEGRRGAEKGELRQAEEVFRQVAELGRADGWVNLARVYEKEGRLDDAVTALAEAIAHPSPAAPWTVAWLSGRVNRQNGHLDAAIRDLRSVLATRVPERGFDFSRDYVVRGELALALFDRAKRARGDRRKTYLEQARDELRTVLDLDSENTLAHHNLHLVSSLLGDRESADRHLRLHDRYRPDDNARDEAIAIYRKSHPAANRAAQSIVIYPLESPP